jgi:hypothetical protein
LRGAAPIQHAIVLKRPFWGVSIQTLHPTKFDHGVVLKQSPIPGVKITSGQTPKDVMPRLAEEGASLLGTVIDQGLFVHPLEPVVLSDTDIQTITGGEKVAFAPKIRDVDMKVNWEIMSADDTVCRLRAFGKLWDDGFLAEDFSSRVVFSELDGIVGADVLTELAENKRPIAVGNAVLLKDSSGETIYIKAANETWVKVIACKIAGMDTIGSMKKIQQMLKQRKCTINKKG